MLRGLSPEEAERTGLLKQLKGYAPKGGTYGALPQEDHDEKSQQELTEKLALLRNSDPSHLTAHLAPTAAQAEGLKAVNTAYALYAPEIVLKRKQMALRELQAQKKHGILWKFFANRGDETRLAQLSGEISALEEKLKTCEYTNRFTAIQEYFQANSEGFVARALKVLNHLNIIIAGSDREIAAENLKANSCKLPTDINIEELLDTQAEGVNDTYIKQRIAILYLRQMTVLMEAQIELNQGKKSAPAEDITLLYQYRSQLNRLKDKVFSIGDENTFLDIAKPNIPTPK